MGNSQHGDDTDSVQKLTGVIQEIVDEEKLVYAVEYLLTPKGREVLRSMLREAHDDGWEKSDMEYSRAFDDAERQMRSGQPSRTPSDKVIKTS